MEQDEVNEASASVSKMLSNSPSEMDEELLMHSVKTHKIHKKKGHPKKKPAKKMPVKHKKVAKKQSPKKKHPAHLSKKQ